MYYSVIAALALIVNLILNWEYIKVFRLKVGTKDQREQIKLRYSHFLASINCFYIVEFLWGLSYDYHDVASFFPVIYSITIFYFIFILLTMLTWTRYIVAYLDRDGRIRGKVLLYSIWVMFILGIMSLQFNRFYHFLFYFDFSCLISFFKILFFLRSCISIFIVFYFLFNNFKWNSILNIFFNFFFYSII